MPNTLYNYRESLRIPVQSMEVTTPKIEDRQQTETENRIHLQHVWSWLILVQELRYVKDKTSEIIKK